MLELARTLVLVTFFLFFTLTLIQLYRDGDRRDFARLPLEDE